MGASPIRPIATPWMVRLVRAYLRSELRGSTRLTRMLASRVPSLQHVPVAMGSTTIYVDLREELGRLLLQRSPWPAPPWEHDEQDVMRRLVSPGDVVFDVGGHLGVHATYLALLVGPAGVVHVFEPNPRRHTGLACAAASCGNLILHRFGLSDRDGRVTLYVPPPLDDAMASLADWTAGRVGAVERVECDVRRLDPMIATGQLPRPDFVKCDVEGAERRVFMGARDVLDRAEAPIVMFEANVAAARAFGDTMSAAAEWLAGLAAPAYRFYHVQPRGTLVPIAPTLTDEHGLFNLVAVPAARADRLR